GEQASCPDGTAAREDEFAEEGEDQKLSPNRWGSWGHGAGFLNFYEIAGLSACDCLLPFALKFFKTTPSEDRRAEGGNVLNQVALRHIDICFDLFAHNMTHGFK